ncbi:MAG TPA: hypothetical protein VMV07_03755 [Streptosporangiaceae bacterium]|nr:hypothetical protein [Streptosporangiaceae bacterium]
MSAYRPLSASPLAVPLLRAAAVAVLAGVAVVVAGEALSTPLPATAAARGGVALAAWCGALLAACSGLAGRDGLGLAQWKMGSWFLLWCALTDGLGSITWDRRQSGLAAQILPSSVTRAEWLTAVAVTAWAIAYCSVPRRLAVVAGGEFMQKIVGRRPGIVRSAKAPWLLYAAGTSARLAGAILTGRFGYAGNAIATVSSAAWYQQELSLATFACPLAITAAGLRLFRERASGAKATLAFLLAAEIASAAVMGQKGQFITAVVAVAVARASAGRGMPRGLILVATALFLLIVIPFTVAYRAEIRGGPADLGPQAAAAAAPAAVGAAASVASIDTIPKSVSYLAQRLQEINASAIVLQKTPSQVQYASPAQIPATLAAALIPRAIWPGKPILDPGYQFSQEYYGTPAELVNATAITPQADLYRYGGWIPVIMGMLALGWLMRVLDDVLDVQQSPPAALLVVLLWPTLATPEGAITGILLALPSLTLTWLVITTATFRRQPHAS